MPRDNRLPSYEALLEFQEVYLRAVALSWTDEAFRNEFLKDPALALEHYFSYRLEWNSVLVAYDPNDPHDPNNHNATQHGWGWNPDKKAWNLPPIETQIGLPIKPKVEEQLLAFAAYNDAGPTYLFTCC